MSNDAYKFELSKTSSPQGYRFTLKDEQGNAVGTSPNYRSKEIALTAIDMLKKNMPTAEVHESSE